MTERIEDLLHRRTDLSTFLVHLTALTVYRRRLDPIVENAAGPMNDLFGTA